MDVGMGRAPGLGWSQEVGCAVCGAHGNCNHWPDITSAFTTDWKKKAPDVKGNPIYAPHRIFENDRLTYAAGDVVPHEHAVRLGLIDAPATPEPEPEPEPVPVTPDETARNRAEARARRQTADRKTTAPEDRSA